MSGECVCDCVCSWVASVYGCNGEIVVGQAGQRQGDAGWRWKEALPGRGDDDSKCKCGGLLRASKAEGMEGAVGRNGG